MKEEDNPSSRNYEWPIEILQCKKCQRFIAKKGWPCKKHFKILFRKGKSCSWKEIAKEFK